MQENILNSIVKSLEPNAHDEINNIINKANIQQLSPELEDIVKTLVGGTSVFKVAKTVKHAPSLLKKLLSWATTAGATGGTLGAIKSLQDRID